MSNPQVPQYQSENHFVYGSYTPQSSPALPSSFKHYPEECPPRPIPTNSEGVHAGYQREPIQTHPTEQDPRPPIKYEPQVATQRSPALAPPIASKTITRNAAEDKANEIEFHTNIDILMKVIQLKDDPEKTPESGEAAYPSPPQLDEEKFNLRRKSCSPAESSTTESQYGRERQKRYVCDIKGCRKRCTQKTQLETHKRAHTGEKPYVCKEPSCGRRFTQRGNLKTHERRHTGEKPYSCDICGKPFAQRGNVKPHRLTHFKAKPFRCILNGCGKSFGQRGNLKTHHNRFHEEAIAELTHKFQNLPPGGELSEEDMKLFRHFAELYKNSNKGIKGRGSNRTVEPKAQISNTPGFPHHYHVQPAALAQQMYQHSQFTSQHGLSGSNEIGHYGIPRGGIVGNMVAPRNQHAAYGMYDMDQASVTSSDTATATSSPVTIYEEEHGRTLLPQHRMY